MKKVISVLLLLSVIISSFVPALAKESTNYSENGTLKVINTMEASELKIKSLDVPDFVKQYSESIVSSLLANIVNNEDMFDVVINDYKDLVLGQPYTIISYDTYDSFNNTYYFPIIENGTIKLILSVTNDDGNCNATLSKDLADELNSLAINATEAPYILYTQNGRLYAENDQNRVLINDIKLNGETSKFKSEDVPYQTKVSELKTVDILTINNDLLDMGNKALILTDELESSNILQKDYSTFAGGIGRYATNPLFINTSTAKLLNTTSVLVNQQDKNGVERNLCWAAVVATIVRYNNGVDNVHAYTVADKMGIGYDTEAGIETMVSALSEYNITYQYDLDRISFSKLQSIIANLRPIVLGGVTSFYAGHAVTIIGYSTNTGTNTFTFWNSGTRSSQICTYGNGKPSFSYNGYTYYWDLSAY